MQYCTVVNRWREARNGREREREREKRVKCAQVEKKAVVEAPAARVIL
jgi:hypothetical protein